MQVFGMNTYFGAKPGKTHFVLWKKKAPKTSTTVALEPLKCDVYVMDGNFNVYYVLPEYPEAQRQALMYNMCATDGEYKRFVEKLIANGYVIPKEEADELKIRAKAKE